MNESEAALSQPDVIIAGGGPVGLMLAAELRLHRVSTVILEQVADPGSVPDGVRGMHARTLETLDRRGLLDTFLAAAAERRPPEGAPAAARRGGRVMTGQHFAGLSTLRLDEQNSDHPYALVATRERIERLILDRVEALGGEISRGHAVTGFTQHDDHVEVEVTGPRGSYQLQGKFLIGCDGGRSTVRKGTGIAFPGNDPTVTGYVGQVRIVEPHDLPTGWTRTGAGAMLLPGTGHGVMVLDFTGPPRDRRGEVTLEEFQDCFRRVTRTQLTLADPQHLRRFSDNTRQAERYRKGRVLLAGDAAHVHAPFGGQGLNLGLQDAVNLGWKLAAEINGWAPPGLLDSYSNERHLVAERVLHNTRAQLALMDPDQRVTPLRELFEDLMNLPDANKYLTELITCVNVTYEVGQEEEQHPLLGRLAPDVGLKTADASTSLVALLRAGRPVLIDLVGEPALHAAAAPWADRIDIVTADADGPYNDADAIVVRPDGYTVWLAGHDEQRNYDLQGLGRALTRWFGQPRGTQ